VLASRITAHRNCPLGLLLRSTSRARPCGRRSRPWISPLRARHPHLQVRYGAKRPCPAAA